MSEGLYQDMAQSIIDGETEDARRLAQAVLDAGVDPLEAINKGFVPGLDEVGENFGCGDMFLPDLVLAAEAMKAAVAVLEPEMTRRGTARRVLGKVVVGTVEGDIHDIGKDLVTLMVDVNGYDVLDIGIDVPVDTFVDRIKEFDPQVVGLSGFLTLAFDSMKKTVEAIEAAGMRNNIKIMIGGGMIDDKIKEYVKADAYGKNAVEAVKLCNEWIEA